MFDAASGSVGDLLAHAAGQLREAGADAPERDARLMLARALGRNEAWLFANREARVSAPEKRQFSALLARRAERVPLSHILGTREFWSLAFTVTPDVLTPRPDSEAVVEAALAAFPVRDRPCRLLDLGTGSGCLLLALLSELPRATGVGIDLSPAALAVAAANGSALGFSERAEWRQGDWAGGLDEAFDIVVSNPPYIASGDIAALAPEVARHEPAAALDGGTDGLDCYRRLLAGVARLLKPDGVLVLETGAAQAVAVRAIATENDLRLAATHADLAGTDRALVFRP